MASKSQKVLDLAEIIGQDLSNSCQEPCFSIIASERYALASIIASRVLQQTIVEKSFSERLDSLATHRVFGYFTSAGVIVGLLLWTFVIGNLLSGLISKAFSFIGPVDPAVNGSLLSVLWSGVLGGLVAGSPWLYHTLFHFTCSWRQSRTQAFSLE